MSLLALAFVLAAQQAGAVPARRAITETDLFRFVWIADPRISPDGRDVAFVRVAVDKKKEGYETALWIVPADGSAPPRAFTNGPHDSAPRWSPDGRRLAFLRAVEKDGKPEPPQIHLIERAGGEARVLTDIPHGASAPVWSPDGRALAFTATANAKDMAKHRKDKVADDERESDVRVVTRAAYRSNADGYSDDTRPSHVWAIGVDGDRAASPRQVTTGRFAEEDPFWSADGSRILFTSTRVEEPYYAPPDSDLFAVDAKGVVPTLVASIDGTVAGAVLAPDGRRVAFSGTLNGNPVRSYDQPDLFVADLGALRPRNLTASLDFDVASGLAGDQHAPRGGRGSAIAWSKDGGSVLFVAAEKGRANLRRLELASGRVQDVTSGSQEVIAFSASADGTRIVALVSTPTEIGDLYVLDAGALGPRRLTALNADLFADLDITPPEEITYPSFDGKVIHAFVQKPPSFDPSRRYPMILDIHGGPHSAYGYTFFHEMHVMAARGYVVLYPNPRGSSTYGQDFGNVIQYRYPGDDHKDLMAGVDELIRRGFVDPRRLGITGGSGGGVLTNWAITQTDRFAAAVSQRSIADWSGFWYTADFTQFIPDWFRAAPWQDPADYAARSAITHVEKVKTPLMLIEGEGDLRTPPSDGGEQMFRALKFLKRPTVMVRFPDESHELSRSGKPWHRIERLQHIVAWFDKYLQGKPAPYEVAP